MANSLNDYSLNRYKPGARTGSFQRPQQAPQPQRGGMAGQNKTFAQLQQEGQARPAPAPPPPTMAPPGLASPASAPKFASASASDTPVADGASKPNRYNKDNTPWINYAGTALDGSKYGSSVNPDARDKTIDRGWGLDGDFTDDQKAAAREYADYLKTLDSSEGWGGARYLQAELSGDPRLSGALNGLTSSTAYYDGVDTKEGNMSWDDWQGERGTAIRDQMQKEQQAQIDERAAQPKQQGSQSLWQAIMGYQPNLPQDYGWEQGWEKYTNKPQNSVHGAPPEMSNTEAAQGLNPGLSQVMGYGSLPGATGNDAPMDYASGSGGMMNNADADQGTGNPGWPNNGPESPNGEGGTYGGGGTPGSQPSAPPTEGGTPPPSTNTPTTPPYTPPTSPNGSPTSTKSPWDDIYNGYATGGGEQDPMFAKILQMLMGYANKPSGYDSDMLVGSYNRLNKQLGEGYDVERQKIKENMYRRGVSDSTVHGGYLGDVATDQARAQSDLSYQLLTDAAQQESTAKSTSLNMLMSMYGLNEQSKSNRMNTGLAYNDQRFNQWLQEYMMNHQVSQDEIDNIIRTMGL